MKKHSLSDIYKAFLSELHTAAAGEHSSLPFIRHRLPTQNTKKVEHQKHIQVIVIGGSIGISAKVEIKEGTPCIQHHTKVQIPQFDTKQEFLQCIAALAEPDTPRIALNMAYGIEPLIRDSRLDGKLLAGAKEQAFHGLLGHTIGEEVERHIAATQRRSVQVSVANDTICLLLSGLADTKPYHLGCGIVGTGLNMAFFLDPHTMVNLESGEFASFAQSKEGGIIDTASEQPGNGRYEKEVSGAYLFQHYNLRARDNGILPINSTEELSQTAQEGRGEAQILAQAVMRHSAEHVAVQIAAITSFKQQNMTFVMEGSLFWQGWQYRQMVEDTLAKILPSYPVQFASYENSAITGAALLVTYSPSS